MKGRVNVLSEVNILMIVYNLRRCLSVLGIEGFRNRLKDLVKTFSKSSSTFYIIIFSLDAFASKKWREKFILEYCK
jgi:hypothetical protein